MLGIEERKAQWLRHRAFTLAIDGWDAWKPAGTQWNPLMMVMERLAGPMVKRFMAEVSTPRPPPPGFPGKPTPRPVQGMEWPEYLVERYGEARG